MKYIIITGVMLLTLIVLVEGIFWFANLGTYAN